MEKFYGNKTSSSKHVSEEFKDIKADSEDTEGDTKGGPLSAVQNFGIIAILCGGHRTDKRHAVRINCTLTGRTFARVCWKT